MKFWLITLFLGSLVSAVCLGVDPATANQDREFLAEISRQNPPAPVTERSSLIQRQPAAPRLESSPPSRPLADYSPIPESDLREGPIEQSDWQSSGASEAPEAAKTKRSTRTGGRSGVHINPLREVKRATAPVRRIVRRILPF